MINCTLKPSPDESTTEALASTVISAATSPAANPLRRPEV